MSVKTVKNQKTKKNNQKKCVTCSAKCLPPFFLSPPKPTRAAVIEKKENQTSKPEQKQTETKAKQKENNRVCWMRSIETLKAVTNYETQSATWTRKKKG